MAFLKRQVFYIGLVAVTVMICVGTYFLITRLRNQGSEKGLASMIRDYKAIVNLGTNGVNTGMVEAEKAKVQETDARFRQMQETRSQSDEQGREPLTITPDGTTDAIKTFPVDEAVYGSVSIQMLFPQAYSDAMDALFAELRSTTPPTEVEAAAATAQMENFMREQALDEMSEGPRDIYPPGVAAPVETVVAAAAAGPARGVRRSRPTPTAAPTDPYGGAGPMSYGPMGGGAGPMAYGPMGGGAGPMGGGSMPGGPAVDTAKARVDAINNLNIKRVTDPNTPIYADPLTSFHRHSLSTSGINTPIEEMWKATVNYWMHKHIVGTINRTNGAGATIETAAVKRLVSMQVGTAAAGRQTIGKTMLYEGEQEPQSDDDAGGGSIMDTSGAAYGGAGPAMGGDSKDQGSLTHRSCTPEYDVVNFNLTVVVASEDLQAFLLNLVNQGFYTVQKVDLYDASGETTTLATVSAGRSGTRTSNTSSTDALYYYGSEPVVKAVIRVEALLFTEWERRDMPVDMLIRLPAEALRPEDSARIAKAGAAAPAAASARRGGYDPY